MNFERIQQVFEAALQIPADGRAAFVETSCKDDAEVARQVLAMLRHEPEAHAWFDSLAEELFPTRDDAPLNVRIGPYRLIRELGRGGMGAVYLAERADGQFDQQVALKLTRLDQSKEILRRFFSERQILSRLEHPGIARLLDGGSAPDGRPYLVMEYVDGVPVSAYCDERALGIEERLRLFIKVGEAVEYAHRNLIVHRDIKPGNILVTREGSPKLLDFGIAKLLDIEDAGAQTQTGLRLLTPDYAAPEQLRGEPVTTATDVYGLGAVLYELLAGVRPLQPVSRAWEDVERAILHGNPPAPSVAAQGKRPERFARTLAGDLDTICLKALAKEPERRYRSVAGLIDDVRRYLEGRPVSARRDTVGYRAIKFIRRHRLGVGIAAGVFLLVTSLTVALAVQSAQTARERDKAQKVSSMFVDLFSVPDPGEGMTITAREVLDRGVRKVTAAPDRDVEVHTSLLDVLGRVHHQLGLYDRASALFEKAVALRTQTLGSDHPEVAETRHRLGMALLDQGKYDAAIDVLNGALDSRRRVLGQGDPATAQTMTFLALAHFRKADYKAAEPLFRRAVEVQRQPRGLNAGLADSLTGLAMLQYGQGKYAEAEPLLREALGIQRKVYGTEHQQIAETLNNLASVLSRLGRDKEAEPVQREALDLLKKMRGSEHPRVATALNNLGLILFARGDLAGAEPLFRESLRIRRARLAPTHPDLAQSLSNLGLLLQNRGQLAEAQSQYLEALDIRRKTLGPAHVAIVQSLNNAGQLLQIRRDYRGAESMLLESLEMGSKLVGRAHPMVAISLNNLASLYDEMGDAKAEPLYREALAIRRKALPAQHPHIAYALVGLGQHLTAHGRAADAEPLLREAAAIRRKVLPEGNWEIAEADSALGECLLSLGRRAEAEALLIPSYRTLVERKGEKSAQAVKAERSLSALRRSR